jgi:hypothetical protein
VRTSPLNTLPRFLGVNKSLANILTYFAKTLDIYGILWYNIPVNKTNPVLLDGGLQYS